MKTAIIRKELNCTNDSKGPDTLQLVDLYKDQELIGTVDVTSHSKHYAEDVVENWESGILREDNEHITKPN